MFLHEAFRRASKTSTNAERLLNPTATEAAFGSLGEPGDPEAIEHLAGCVIDLYGALLDWAREIRSAILPELPDEAQEIAATMNDMAIRQMRAFAEQVVDEIDRLPAMLRGDAPMPTDLGFHLNLDVDDGLVEAFGAAMERASGSLGEGRMGLDPTGFPQLPRKYEPGTTCSRAARFDIRSPVSPTQTDVPRASQGSLTKWPIRDPGPPREIPPRIEHQNYVWSLPPLDSGRSDGLALMASLDSARAPDVGGVGRYWHAHARRNDRRPCNRKLATCRSYGAGCPGFDPQCRCCRGRIRDVDKALSFRGSDRTLFASGSIQHDHQRCHWLPRSRRGRHRYRRL